MKLRLALSLLLMSLAQFAVAQTTTVTFPIPAGGCATISNCIVFANTGGWNGEGGEVWFDSNWLILNNGSGTPAGSNALDCMQGASNCLSFQDSISNVGPTLCPPGYNLKPCSLWTVSATAVGISPFDGSQYTLSLNETFVKYWVNGNRWAGYRYKLTGGGITLTASDGTIGWMGL